MAPEPGPRPQGTAGPGQADPAARAGASLTQDAGDPAVPSRSVRYNRHTSPSTDGRTQGTNSGDPGTASNSLLFFPAPELAALTHIVSVILKSSTCSSPKLQEVRAIS